MRYKWTRMYATVAVLVASLQLQHGAVVLASSGVLSSGNEGSGAKITTTSSQAPSITTTTALVSSIALSQPQLTLIRPVSGMGTFDQNGTIVIKSEDTGGAKMTMQYMLLGSFTADDKLFFTRSNEHCDNTKFDNLDTGSGNILTLNDDKTVATVKISVPMQSADTTLYICICSMDVCAHQGSGTSGKIEFTTLKYKLIKQGLSVTAMVIIISILLVLSGLFSGLNLGLMALDTRELEIFASTGTPIQQKHAGEILPLRKRGNLLLCTMLIGNVLVNSVATTLLGSIASGTTAVLASTAGIVVFGEIIPQALCSRHGLYIGAKTTYVTWFFLILCFPVSFPISKILDWMLGEEVGTVYQKSQLLEMMRTEANALLDQDERDIVTGAMTYADKTVDMVMTPIADVFCLHMDEVLDFDTIRRVMDSGYSRIPVIVQHGMRFEMKAVLFVKDMAFVDPKDRIPVESMIKYNQHASEVLEVWEDKKLDDMLDSFKIKRTHLAAVLRSDKEDDMSPDASLATHKGHTELIGIVTLEDVIEEIIGAEIYDEHEETDSHGREPDIKMPTKTASRYESDGDRVDPLPAVDQANSGEATRETLLRGSRPPSPIDRDDAVQGEEIESSEPAAPVPTSFEDQLQRDDGSSTALLAASFLAEKVDVFKEPTISNRVLNQLIANGVLMKTIPVNATEAQRTLYRAGLETKVFTLVIEGQVQITVGKAGLQMQKGAWTTLCEEALTSETAYKPDFTVVVNVHTKAVMFQLNRAQYKEALRGSIVERLSSGIARGEVVRVAAVPQQMPSTGSTKPSTSALTPRQQRSGSDPTSPNRPLAKKSGTISEGLGGVTSKLRSTKGSGSNLKGLNSKRGSSTNV